jgi:hypothetical protein
VLATYTLEEGRVDDIAASRLAAAHRIHRELRDYPDRYGHALLLCRFALALALRERATAAAMVLACYDARREELAVTEDESWVVRMNDRTLAAVRARIDDAAIAAAWEQGRKLSTDDAVELALAHLD